MLDSDSDSETELIPSLRVVKSENSFFTRYQPTLLENTIESRHTKENSLVLLASLRSARNNIFKTYFGVFPS